MNFESIVATTKDVANTCVTEGIKGAQWLGHTVQQLWNEDALPFLEKLCAAAATQFRAFQNYVQGRPAIGAAFAAALFLASLGAFDRAGNPDNGTIVSTLWKTAGVAAFLGGIAVSAATISTLV